uniref:Uncharacterized protein n=1 Tax=Globodera rostochiensis TaxID=31243 RepID=A0A914HFU3_GLORO
MCCTFTGQTSTIFVKSSKTRWNSTLSSLKSVQFHKENLQNYLVQHPTCASVRLINRLSQADFDEKMPLCRVTNILSMCSKNTSQNTIVNFHVSYAKSWDEELTMFYERGS